MTTNSDLKIESSSVDGESDEISNISTRHDVNQRLKFLKKGLNKYQIHLLDEKNANKAKEIYELEVCLFLKLNKYPKMK